MKQTKWVVQKSMHLGHIKTGVMVGSVIIYDEENNKLIIDGKVFDSTKDLEIMKRHNWVTPFDDTKARHVAEKAQVAEVKKIEETKAKDVEENKRKAELPVVKSDADEFGDIDISYTKKVASLPKEKNADLPVIRGDESPEERVKRLQSEVPVLEVVRDDSLGTPITNSVTPTGVKKLSAEEHAKLRAEALEKAKKGFVDPRIAEAQKAVDAVVPAKPAEVPVKRGPGRPKKAMPVKGTTETVVAATAPALPKIDVSKL